LGEDFLAGHGKSPPSRRLDWGRPCVKKRVLVVEDDERIRKVVRIILSCEELEVDEVPGGREAIRHLDEGTYDLSSST
jgi:PleD family two-component response regulator